MVTAVSGVSAAAAQLLNIVNKAGGSGAVGYSYTLGKKGNPYVVCGATPAFAMTGVALCAECLPKRKEGP